MSAATDTLGTLRFNNGESGLFISQDSDRYGLIIPFSSSSSCFLISSSWSSASLLSLRFMFCLFWYSPSLCNPGTTLIILGLKYSFLNMKPRSMNPLTSSSSNSPKLLQLMDFGRIVNEPERLKYLGRFWVDGDEECERVLLCARLNLIRLSFWLISLSSSSSSSSSLLESISFS